MHMFSIMSFGPCYDIRLKAQNEKKPKDERLTSQSQDSNKENHTPVGVINTSGSFRGRGRGLLSLRQRLEERKQRNLRTYLNIKGSFNKNGPSYTFLVGNTTNIAAKSPAVSSIRLAPNFGQSKVTSAIKKGKFRIEM